MKTTILKVAALLIAVTSITTIASAQMNHGDGYYSCRTESHSYVFRGPSRSDVIERCKRNAATSNFQCEQNATCRSSSSTQHCDMWGKCSDVHTIPIWSASWTCAPEVKEGNVKATDRVLTDLANGELKEATKFKSLVTAISQKGSDERLSSYLGLAGVQTDDEIAAFVGSRDGKIDAKYIVELSKNAELTNEQSEMVLKKVSGSLLGERK